MPLKKALFLCSGQETLSDLLLLRPILRAMLDAGYEVEYFAPEDFELDSGAHHVSWQPGVEYPGIRWFYHSFILPIVIIQYCVARKYDAVVSASPYLLFVTWFASFLIVAKRILCVRTLRRRKASFIGRLIMGFQDFLGLLASTWILVPGSRTREEIAEVSSILEEKVIELPIARSSFSAEELLEESDEREEHQIILERYEFSDRTKICIAQLDDVSFETAYYCLKLFYVLDNDKMALFLLGSNEQQNSLMAIAVGLGLVEKVFFIESEDEAQVIATHADYSFLLNGYDDSSYFSNLSRAHRGTLLKLYSTDVVDSELDETLVGSFSRHIEEDSQILKNFFKSKKARSELQTKQRNSIRWSQQSWGAEALERLGL